jgi:hypothetical protein
LTVKVNASEPVPVLYNTLDYINPVATEKRNLEIIKVKRSDLLYLTIVRVVYPRYCGPPVIAQNF